MFLLGSSCSKTKENSLNYGRLKTGLCVSVCVRGGEEMQRESTNFHLKN